MGNKKLIKGLIITLVILLIIGGALAYIYFGTDLLKTDAELFAKYGGRATSALGQFLESGNTKTYYQKKQNQNYENDTKLNVKLNIGNDNPQYETILALKGADEHFKTAIYSCISKCIATYHIFGTWFQTILTVFLSSNFPILYHRKF